MLCDSAQAAITKYHRLGGLNNRNLFLMVLEVRNSRSSAAGLFLLGALFLACLSSWHATCSLQPSHGLSSEHVTGERNLPLPLLIGLPVPLGEGPPFKCHSTSITSYGPVSKYSHIGYVGLQRMNLGQVGKGTVREHNLIHSRLQNKAKQKILI